MDTTPPSVFVTSPETATVAARMVNVEGYVPEGIRSLQFQVRNALGLTEQQPADIVNRERILELRKTLRTDFICRDVPLAEGSNDVFLEAIDLAGNRATDFGGNTATEQVSIERSEVTIQTDPIPQEQLTKQKMRVTGTLDRPGFTVWINGIKADMKGMRWVAEGVQFPGPGRIGLIQAVAPHNEYVVTEQWSNTVLADDGCGIGN